jgi:speckle-type POZ protein
VAGSVTAMHEFVVTSFSLIDGMGTGKFVSSATFTVAGRDWTIRLCPDGYRTEHKGYVSVILHFLKGEIGVRVKFTISLFLVDKGDQVSETEPQYNTFDSVGVGLSHNPSSKSCCSLIRMTVSQSSVF